MTKLLYQGHASFRLTTNKGTVVYIDPFMGEGYDVKANLILVTHEHYDHNQIDLPLKDENTVIFRSSDAIKDNSYVHTIIEDIDIIPTAAYNKNHKKEECVGYIITVDNLRLYFAGDTSITKEMNDIKDIDYAFLPTDGIYNMDYKEAEQCSNIIKAKHSVPIHSYPNHLYSEEIFNNFNGYNKYVIIPGEEIDLEVI